MVTTAAAHHYHKQYRKEYSRHFHSPRTSGFFLILEESRLPPSVHETDAVAFRAARLSLFWILLVFPVFRTFIRVTQIKRVQGVAFCRPGTHVGTLVQTGEFCEKLPNGRSSSLRQSAFGFSHLACWRTPKQLTSLFGKSRSPSQTSISSS